MPHLYLHVPFCQRRCSYCDFSIAVRKRIPAREYVDAVLQELKLLGTTDPGRKPGETEAVGLDTLYLGGGTPSLLPPEAISVLLTSLLDVFRATSSRDAVEVTMEANPEDVKPEIAAAWRRAGVNRVSLGAPCRGVRQHLARSHFCASCGARARLGARLGPRLLPAPCAPLSVSAHRRGAHSPRPLDLARRRRDAGRRALRRSVPACPHAPCGLRLSVLRGLERVSRRVPLAP